MATSGRQGDARRARAEQGGDAQQQDEHEGMLPILDDWLTPDEIQQIGDLGGGEDDIEGPEQSKLSQPSDRREAYLLDRVMDACRALAAHRAKRRAQRDEENDRVPDEVWRRLGDQALGLSEQAADSGEAEPDERSSQELGVSDLPPGIAASLRSNLVGFMRVMSWIEAGALRDGRGDVLRAIRALIARAQPSRMPQ